VEKLGVGGYGAVYRVVDPHHPGVPLALKLALRPGDVRAEREVVLLMDKAVHPHVVRFHGCGRWPDPIEGHTYHVMDLISGPPLDVWAETLNPSFLQFTAAGAKMALTLGELHARGVAHRDIKPENILIREADGAPILVDFGIGSYKGAASLTPTPLPPGTAHLRSPEAMRFWLERDSHAGETYEVGAADDLYALGVSLYRAVTGHYPFKPEVLGDLLALAIVDRRVHAPRDFNRRVPRALSDVLSRMLAKDPEARYGSGAEVHEALIAAATFGKRGEWEASLFEWEHGGIRRPAFPTRPMTVTGPRFLLVPGGSSAGRRGRGGQAGALAPALEGRRGQRLALPGGALAVALGLGLALSGLWAVPRHSASGDLTPGSGEMARAPELPDAGSAAAPLPLESNPAAAALAEARATKGTSLKKPQQKTPGESPPQPGSVGRLLGTTTFCVGLACAGVQVRPPRDRVCPAESRAVMKELGLDWKLGPMVITDIKQGPPGPTEAETHAIVRSGPITSMSETAYGQFPEGTLFFGELFTESTNVYGWYDRARTPDGKTYRVCFTVGNHAEDGLEKLPGSRPGAVHISRAVPITAVKRFVFKEPPRPEPELED
jgi:serine/threonine-protein kinase